MPTFWEFPTVSMGLTGINSIYQARFNRYLTNRGIKDTSGQHVWAFMGDGEMGEPESLGAIRVAAREGLDNLTYVINCNLQQLDGPCWATARSSRNLESFFLGAGWHVIKVLWGRDWDPLLAADAAGALVNKMNTTPDGPVPDLPGRGRRVHPEQLLPDPRAARMVGELSDEEIKVLSRGGTTTARCTRRSRPRRAHGQPTVIWPRPSRAGRSTPWKGKNATHQMKKLTTQGPQGLPRSALPGDPGQPARGPVQPAVLPPGQDTEEIQYLQERRKGLGGYIPGAPESSRRSSSCPATRCTHR
jgi:pyruvate dehydrogenase E1 component